MKSTVVKKMNGRTDLVLHNGELKILQTFRFPEKQSDFFDWMMQGKSLPDVEEDMRQQAKALLDAFQNSRNTAHLLVPEDLEMEKIPGGNGWQTEVTFNPMLSLEQFLRYHTLIGKEKEHLSAQLLDALKEIRQARLPRPHLRASNVFVAEENRFLLAMGTGNEKIKDTDAELENQVKTFIGSLGSTAGWS